MHLNEFARHISIYRARQDQSEELSNLIRSVVSSVAQYPLWLREQEKRNYEPEDVRALIADKASLLLVAQIGRELVAFIAGKFIDAQTFSLEWIGVDPMHRRSGIASSLLAHLEKELVNNEIEKILCEVNPQNGPTLAMLATAHYQPTHAKRFWENIEHQEWKREITARL